MIKYDDIIKYNVFHGINAQNMVFILDILPGITKGHYRVCYVDALGNCDYWNIYDKDSGFTIDGIEIYATSNDGLSQADIDKVKTNIIRHRIEYSNYEIEKALENI